MTTTDEQATDWGRQPPQNLDAEIAVLGSMMMSKDAVADVVEILRPDDFYRPAHQAVYDAAVSLYAGGEPVDPLTVAKALGKSLQRAGGAPGLVSMIEAVPTAASASYYARMVADMAAMRRLVEAGTRITQYGYTGADGGDVDEVRNMAQTEIYAATQRHETSEAPSMSRALTLVHDELSMIEAGGGLGGVPTGLRDLDDLLHGLHPGTVTVIAGRPGCGKSVMAIDALRSCSIVNGWPAVLFSLEMSRNEVMMRVLSAETNIPLKTMRAGKMDDAQWATLSTRMHEIEDRPLFIDDAPNLSMMEIRAKSRRMKQQHGLRLIVVDYLQLMGGGGQRHESRQLEVSELARQLKLLAMELEVPVVVLAQLNRNSESRADKRPQVADLRESGSIEATADVVILIHRPDMYDADDPRGGEVDLIVGKHRNGPTGTVVAAHRLHVAKFADLARGQEFRADRNW